MSRAIALLILVSFVSGCAPHVSLRVPRRGASEATRLAAYDQLRPAGQHHTITVTSSTSGTSVSHQTDLILANGSVVAHAGDLLPVVEPGSATARTARKSAAARRSRKRWGGGGGVLTAIGVSMIVSSMSRHDRDDPYRPSGEGNALLMGGVALGFFGLLVAGVGELYFAPTERSARAAAFMLYDESLRQRLDLCVDGLQVGSCTAEPAAAAW